MQELQKTQMPGNSPAPSSCRLWKPSVGGETGQDWRHCKDAHALPHAATWECVLARLTSGKWRGYHLASKWIFPLLEMLLLHELRCIECHSGKESGVWGSSYKSYQLQLAISMNQAGGRRDNTAEKKYSWNSVLEKWMVGISETLYGYYRAKCKVGVHVYTFSLPYVIIFKIHILTISLITQSIFRVFSLTFWLIWCLRECVLLTLRKL